MTEIIGLGEGTLKTIETALSQEDLTLAPAKIPSSAFTQTTPRRALARAKTNRHIKNHYAWISSAVDSRDCLNNGGSTVGLTRRALPGGED
ncbi:hypothetical protein GCM10007170_45770 [Arthrobacter liuii]|uniref:Uncharacterized protein n=2 Tax=Arthrobacter liuii TaxID=1476996 RepID=A0ABQ2B394_9MICC|nr:hypothetical protein GCM10007170_45770 [Arthrobacter liuii]